MMWRCLVAVSALCLLPSFARASSAINLSPASHDVVLSADAQTESLSFQISNNTAAPVLVQLSAVDFGPLGETGGIAFLGQDDRSWQHRLTPWLTLDRDQISLAPGESSGVNVQISNRLDLTPGGHYAAVLAELKDAVGLADLPRSAVGWQGVMASQFYVLKTGGESYDLRLLDLRPDGFIWRRPTEVALRWRADGNTHVKPYGTVTVRSARGRVVAEAIINENSALILPGAARVINSQLVTKSFWWPGRYSVEVAYHHQASEQVERSQFDWWYVPVWFPVALALAVGLVVWRRRRV